MDPSDSEVIVLEEITDPIQKGSHSIANSDACANKNSSLELTQLIYNGGEDDEDIDEVPDFDDADLQVLDCWEDEVEDQDQAKEGGKVHELKEENFGVTSNRSSCPLESIEKSHVSHPERHEKRTSSCESDATILFEDLTHLDDSRIVEHVKCSDKGKAQGKSREVTKSNRHDEVKTESSKTYVSTKGSKAQRKENSKKDVDHSCGKSLPGKELKLPTDPTETKVDNFLKQMALQHTHVCSLREKSEKSTSLESVSSASSENVSLNILPSPNIDPSDLPPGVDLEQVVQDTSTSSLLASAAKAMEQKKPVFPPSGNSMGESSSIPAPMDPSQKVSREHLSDSFDARSSKQHHTSGRSRTDTIKSKERRSRSPHAKQHSSRSSRSSPPHKMRRTSPARSFTLSPSPSPRSRRLSRSPLLCVRTSHSSSLDTNYTHNAPKYLNRPSAYRSPSIERNRFRRSPVRDPSMLRELSRSLSRDRLEHRSRSKIRTHDRRRSRSRHHYSSKEDRVRRYRRSSSRSWSPGRRGRSRSRSRSHSRSRHRYVQKKTPLRDEVRSKRLNASRSTSRSRSPWKPPPETSSNEVYCY